MQRPQNAASSEGLPSTRCPWVTCRLLHSRLQDIDHAAIMLMVVARRLFVHVLLQVWLFKSPSVVVLNTIIVATVNMIISHIGIQALI